MAGTIKLDGTTFLTKDSSNNFTLDVGSGGSISQGTIGSNVTFPAGTVVGYEKNQTAISSIQSASSTYTDITGSSITYTPTTGASYIVYECSFVESGDNSDASPMFAFRFLIDGSITKNQDSYAPYYTALNSNFSTSRKTHRMIYSASGWTSDKIVKMQFRAYRSSSNRGGLHINYFDYLSSDGSDLGNTDRYTDVDVTIYSVM